MTLEKLADSLPFEVEAAWGDCSATRTADGLLVGDYDRSIKFGSLVLTCSKFAPQHFTHLRRRLSRAGWVCKSFCITQGLGCKMEMTWNDIKHGRAA